MNAISTSLLEIFDTPLYIFGPDRRLVHATLACCDLLGYAPDEMLALKIDEIAEDLDTAREQPGTTPDANEAGPPLSIVYKRKDGSRFCACADSRPLETTGEIYTVHRVCQGTELVPATRRLESFATPSRIVQQVPFPAVLCDATGAAVEANAAWRERFGPALKSAPGLRAWLRDLDQRSTRADEAAGPQAFRGEIRTERDDGKPRRWTVQSGPVYTPESSDMTVLIVATESTDPELDHEAVRLADSMLHAAQEGIIITDSERRIIRANPAFTRITGYSVDEVLGLDPGFLSSGRHGPDFYRRMWAQIDETGHWQGEIWNRRKSGEIYPELLSISAIRDSAGIVSNYSGLFTDLTWIKRTEAEIQRMANYDLLTGLPNLVHAKSLIEAALIRSSAGGQSLVVALCGIDRFKLINDSYGIKVGDRVIIEFSRRLHETFDDMLTVARYGSDMFLLIGQTDNVIQLVREIQNRVAEIRSDGIMRVADGPLHISVSTGIAQYPLCGSDADSLLKNAEVAMFRAKNESPGSTTYYCRDFSKRARQQLELESDLRQALTRREIEVHFQPLLDAKSHVVFGCEALARWHHPARGPVPTEDFISLAEDCSMMHDLGAYLIRETFDTFRKINARWPGILRLSINISPTQLLDPSFCTVLDDARRASGMEASQVEVEITERMFIGQDEERLDRLNWLTKNGYRVAIDDFGTGFSSLAYLRKFQFSTLKLDRSFIMNLAVKANDQRIVRSIIAMAHALEIVVVAEGVARQEQIDFLNGLDCDLFQGWYFSKALPGPEFAQFVERTGLIRERI